MGASYQYETVTSDIQNCNHMLNCAHCRSGGPSYCHCSLFQLCMRAVDIFRNIITILKRTQKIIPRRRVDSSLWATKLLLHISSIIRHVKSYFNGTISFTDVCFMSVAVRFSYNWDLVSYLGNDETNSVFTSLLAVFFILDIV
jgi:hypothetical protein